jgi:hypothetical protein
MIRKKDSKERRSQETRRKQVCRETSQAMVVTSNPWQVIMGFCVAFAIHKTLQTCRMHPSSSASV